MNKKSMRVICLILAALMMLTAFSALFAQVAFAVDSSFELSGNAPTIKLEANEQTVTNLERNKPYTIEFNLKDANAPKIASNELPIDKISLSNLSGSNFDITDSEVIVFNKTDTSGSLVLHIKLTALWTGGSGKSISFSLGYQYNGADYTGNYSYTFDKLATGGSTSSDSGFSWDTDPEFDGESARSLREGRKYTLTFQFTDNNITFSDMDPQYYAYDEDTQKLSVIKQTVEGFVEENGGNFSVVSTATINLVGASGKVKDQKYQHPVYSVSVEVTPDGVGKKLNFNIDYEYYSDSGYLVRNSDSMSRTINETRITSSKDDDEDEDEDDETYLTATPSIIITSYSYGGVDVLAGSEFPLNVTFQNTSGEVDLENIILDLVTSSGLAIVSGSNSLFLEHLGAGQSKTSTFRMMALSNLEKIEPQQITAKFTYEYVQDKKRITDKTRTEVLAVPVTQVIRFEVGELSVPDQLWPGEGTGFSIDYINKGKTEVANLAARLETNVPGVGENQNVGNVKAGDSGSIDFTMTVNDPGTVTGKVIVTYEDLKGQEQSIERPFTTTVMDMSGMGGGDEDMMKPMPMPEETGMPTTTKVIAVIGGLMVAGLTGSVVVKKVKAKREEETDEDI